MNRTKYLQGTCKQCGGPVEYPAEMIGQTVPCPRCGKQTELLLAEPAAEPAAPRKVAVWTVGAILILVLGLAGALTALKRAQIWSIRKAQAAGQPPPGLAVSAITVERKPDRPITYAIGTVTNLLNRPRRQVKVALDLFDARGRKVWTLSCGRDFLAGRDLWSFRVPIGNLEASSAKVVSIKEEP